MRALNGQLSCTPARERPAAERVHDFGEVCQGYTAQEAENEAQRCMDCKGRPCVAGCPVGVDIPRFVRAVAEGDFARGWAVVREANSLPAICGRVCPQETQCQAPCVRGRRGEPVGIGRLERFVADWASQHPAEAEAARGELAAANSEAADDCGRTDGPLPLAGRSVACVGSGPASLTCAAELAALGCEVTIYEALHEAGGVLAYGIPEFRLPSSLLQREVHGLEAAGVRIRTDAVIGKLFTVEELMGRLGHEAVFLGTGAGLPRYLNIPGECLSGVCVANELLTRVNLMGAWRFPQQADTPVRVGERCVVVGGGNVAMDAARTALRLGAQVTIVYRRGEEEMPARAEELAHAKQEGVRLETLAVPVKALGDEDGWVRALRCQRMRLGTPDESGRRRPEPVQGELFELACDTLVVAVGSRVNPLVAQTTPGLATTQAGPIVADARSGATSVPGVFAGGDASTGAATVILAMGAGKRAAQGIASYLASSC